MVTENTYGLDLAFERAVALTCASRPKFWGQVGHVLDPNALNDESCKLIVKACHAIHKDVGHGPSHPVIVLQRLRRWVEEGSVTIEQTEAVHDLFDEGLTPPAEADLARELVPVLARRMQAGAVRMAMDEYARRGDFEEVAKIIGKARRLGIQDVSIGTRLGVGSFEEIKKLRHLDKLELGISELDVGLGGGPPRGTVTLWIAKSGGGKSMQLAHSTAHNLAKGYFVVCATLELSEAVQLARVKANLTGVSVNEIMEGDESTAAKLIEQMYPTLGTYIVKEFPAKATSMLDIREWIKECELSEGYPVDVVVIDYIGKMKSHNRQDKDEYTGAGTVIEDFRLFMHETKKWGLTAEQATRRAGKEKGRQIEMDDVADSMHKVRVPDLVITMNSDSTGELIDQAIVKFRHGRSNWSTGPIPHDWGCARMVYANGGRP